MILATTVLKLDMGMGSAHRRAELCTVERRPHLWWGLSYAPHS